MTELFTVIVKESRYIFNRSRFLDAFPDSLISNILTLSSDTEIELTQPCITSYVMTLLQEITESLVLPLSIDKGEPLASASNYLGIDVLRIISAPQWKWICKDRIFAPSLMTLPVTKYTPDGEVDGCDKMELLFMWAVESNYPSLVEYLVGRGQDPSILDSLALRKVVYYEHISVMNVLLRDHRIDPNTSQDYCIRTAAELGNVEIVNRLLQDSRVDLTVYGNSALEAAVSNGHLDVVDRLLLDPRVNPREALILAYVYKHPAIIERIQDDSRITPEIIEKAVTDSTFIG